MWFEWTCAIRLQCAIVWSLCWSHDLPSNPVNQDFDFSFSHLVLVILLLFQLLFLFFWGPVVCSSRPLQTALPLQRGWSCSLWGLSNLSYLSSGEALSWERSLTNSTGWGEGGCRQTSDFRLPSCLKASLIVGRKEVIFECVGTRGVCQCDSYKKHSRRNTSLGENVFVWTF